MESETVRESQRRNSGNKRGQILQAALEMFLEKDFYQVTITEIAGRAAVGKGTVYEYFPSKKQLYKDCFAYCSEAYLQAFRQHLRGSGSVRETMQSIAAAHLELLRENGPRLRLLFRERPQGFQELQNWILQQREELLLAVCRLLERGVKSGEVRGDVDIEMAGRLFLALTHVVVGGMVIFDDVAVPPERLENLFNIYWQGLKT